jgi:hypothetical protein
MWSIPEPGDIVWCRFPERPRDVPGPKPRPALVLEVSQYEDGHLLKVAYGTSKKVNQLMAGEFAICKLANPLAYQLAGLAFDTKFDLRTVVEIPWDELFFAVPPRPEHGQHPKLGVLHPGLVKVVASALRAISK